MVTLWPCKRYAPARVSKTAALDRRSALLYTSPTLSIPLPPTAELLMSISRPRQHSQPTLQAPCVRNCCLDGSEICLGCGRSLQEILQWGNASNEQREAILTRAAERRQNR